MPTICHTTPDYRRLKAVLRRDVPDCVPLYEFFSDGNVQRAALGDWPQSDRLPLGGNHALDEHIRCQYYLGYDYLSPWAAFGYEVARKEATDIAGLPHGYLNDSAAPIKSRADMERFDWPTPEIVDYSQIDYCSAHLPEGMKLVCNLGSGLLEWGMWLMGAECFCTTLYDDPELISEILRRINVQQVAVATQAASHPDVMACAMGDDMGFKTQTFLPPHLLRKLIFPGLRKIADAVHAQGKFFILHVCGNINDVMDDLISDVGFDAKHSFEDIIMPVTEAKTLYGSRVALLGGVDMDKLCTYEQPQLKSYIAEIISHCSYGGGFALGSGNSIANYVPPQSLRTMCEQAVLCQR